MLPPAKQSLDEETQTRLNVKEYELELEDYIVEQERFERGLYEDFRDYHDNLLLEKRLANADFFVSTVIGRASEEEISEAYSNAEELWRRRVQNRTEWFNQAMDFRFHGRPPAPRLREYT